MSRSEGRWLAPGSPLAWAGNCCAQSCTQSPLSVCLLPPLRLLLLLYDVACPSHYWQRTDAKVDETRESRVALASSGLVDWWSRHVDGWKDYSLLLDTHARTDTPAVVVAIVCCCWCGQRRRLRAKGPQTTRGPGWPVAPPPFHSPSCSPLSALSSLSHTETECFIFVLVQRGQTNS